MRERSHSEKAEPRVLRTRRWWRQVSHRPAGGRDMPPKYGSGHVADPARVIAKNGDVPDASDRGERMRQALARARRHAARDRRLARDRPGLVRGHDRAVRAAPTTTSCATSATFQLAMGAASRCWPSGAPPGACRSCSSPSCRTRSTRSTTCSTSAGPTRAGRGRSTSSSLLLLTALARLDLLRDGASAGARRR